MKVHKVENFTIFETINTKSMITAIAAAPTFHLCKGGPSVRAINGRR